MLEFLTKSTDVQVKDDTGLFEGYAAIFNESDQSGDVIRPGAFLSSLAQRKAPVRMLWQHDPWNPIGGWIHIEEDSKGLYVVGKLAMTTLGRDVHKLLKDKAIDGLSIGFMTVQAENDRDAGQRDVLEIDLWEISVVTFPQHLNARIGEVKNQNDLAMRLRRAGFSPAEAKAIAKGGYDNAFGESNSPRSDDIIGLMERTANIMKG